MKPVVTHGNIFVLQDKLKSLEGVADRLAVVERTTRRRKRELRQVKASLREMLDAYWGAGDGDTPPAFIECAIRLSGYKHKKTLPDGTGRTEFGGGRVKHPTLAELFQEGPLGKKRKQYAYCLAQEPGGA